MSIVVENLSHIYMKGSPFERKALDNISLVINQGEFVGIIGHTGSGKSTLIQHFNGILKPTSGTVVVDGINTLEKGLKELRKKVGIVFQYPEQQLFEETVYKDIAFGLKQLNHKEDEIDKKIKNVIRIVGLDESILEKSPFELSGGQKRRVAIAGILVMEPSILVLDEPAAGLDPKGRNEIFGFLKKLYDEVKITIIIVSHNMEEVAKIVNRVIVINKGKIAMDGSPGEIFSDVSTLENIGLSAPQITHLMKKLKKKVPGLKDDIFIVEEAKMEILRYLKGGTHD
ncbi:MAG: energy-coupling factor transporter ATPase [Clostridiaceae bacterium]|jgi:energy-coupling factor transport system ATP-binding protein|nr:energy-coupling factor transporter ATPase [Clostridiaceae bacterium]